MSIQSVDELRALYGFSSGRAEKKQLPSLEAHSIHFIEKSPFAVISTIDKDGKMDTSPRGGKPGFVKVVNNNQIILPDSKGNNRIDSLVNIVTTGRIGMLFLIPGVDETLRVNGSAFISTDSEYLDQFDAEKKPPKSCLIITVEEVFIHCAKAMMRSGLWDVSAQINREDFPTIGQILKDQLGSSEAPESQKDMVERYQKDL